MVNLKYLFIQSKLKSKLTMILKLPFKKAWYYREKPIEIMLRIGTLEDVCEDLNIKFYEIKESMTKNSFDFSVMLLYHGYLTACEKKGIKVKYDKVQAAIWYEYMSVKEKEKFIQEMTVLFGKMIEAYKPIGKKKVTTKRSGTNSEVLPSES